MAKVREGRERRRTTGCMVGVAVVAIAIVGLAPSRGVVASQDAPSSAKGKKYVATRDITVDKATGALRKPTTAETQELVDTLTAMLRGTTEAVTPVTLPSGVMEINLAGHPAPVMLARPNADGTTEIRCVTTFQEALDFLGLVEAPVQQ